MHVTLGRRLPASIIVPVALTVACGCAPETPPDAVDRLLELDIRGRSIVVVLSDTHRWDHVSPSPDPERSLTPSVARMMADGATFEEVLTPVPISAPAYATLMTGMAPLEHGLLNNEQDLRADLPLLQERLRGAGYVTAAVVGNPFCSAGHGFARGFDHFWDRIDGRGNHGEVITDEALRWLATVGDGTPFFLFLAYMDAHTPYINDEIPPSLRVEVNGSHLLDARAENAHVEQRYPLDLQPGRNLVELSFLDNGEPATPADQPSPLHVRQLRLASGRKFDRTRGVEPVSGTGFERLANRSELVISNRRRTPVADELVFRCYRKYRHENIPRFYRTGVRSFDRSLGRLIAALEDRGLYEEAVVIFLSDHGEMLGEHGAWGHVLHIHQESLRVPMVITAPGLTGGTIGRSRLGLSHVHDLILELALGPDTSRRQALEERAFRPFIAATYPPEGGTLKVAAIHDGLKAVVTADGVEQVFDLTTDPGERTDLAAARRGSDVIDSLLTAARDELAAAASAELLDMELLSPDERDRLRALGYLGPEH